MPQHQPQPELRSESGGGGEVSELGADAVEEKTGEALAVNGGDARRCNPPD